MRIFLVALFVAFASWLSAQNTFRIGPGVFIGDTTQTHEIILVNYSKILGVCLDVTEDEVEFKLRSADEPTIFPKADIRFLGLFARGTTVNDQVGRGNKPLQTGTSSIAFADATYHRTALPNRGKGQVRVVNILYSVAEFNLNENIQLGVGLLTPAGPMMTQRVRFSLADEINIGVSNQAFYTIFVNGDFASLIGDLQLNLTLGNENRFFNVGTGIFYNTSDDLAPVHINLSMGGRVGERWHLYGELAIVDDNFDTLIFPSISAAHTVRRHRWRYGFISVLTPFDGPLLPIPLIGYEYHW